MRVLLDDQPISVSDPTLASALDEARKRAEAARRVVVEASIDGLVVPDEALASPPHEQLPESEIRFITADPVELVRSTMLEVVTLLSDTRQRQVRTAELIHAGNLSEAMAELSQALGAWDNVNQVVINGAALLRIDAHTLVLTPNRGGADATIVVSEHIRSLASHLQEVKRAIAAQDWAGVADVVQFDLGQQVDAWSRLLESLAGALPSLAARS